MTTPPLLKQLKTPLVKPALVKSLRRSLETPVQLGEALATIRLLAELDPALVVEILAPQLTRLPPLLQLEGLAIMTLLGRQVQGKISAHRPNQPLSQASGQAPGRTSARRQSLWQPLLRWRYTRQGHNLQRHLRSVDALMTPIAPPEIFAAALRYRLYLGPAIAPRALQLHLQPERSPAIRAVAAAFALNPSFGNLGNLRVENLTFRSILGQSAIDHPTPRDRLTQSHWRALVPQAQEILRGMLGHRAQEERLAASEALQELADLTPFKTQIPALLEDFSPQVREAVIAAIGQTRSPALYPHLLKALRSPLTAQLAHCALVQLGNEAIPLLQRCTRHPGLSLQTKARSWKILAEMGTAQAQAALAEDVLHQQGEARARLLGLLVSQPQGAIACSLSLAQALAGSEGILQLVREELWLLSQLYAALTELHPQGFPGQAVGRLRQALKNQQRDGGERILLLLQLRYPKDNLARVAQQLRHRATLPQGLKRLAQLLDPPLREPLLAVFDARSARSKRAALAAWEDGPDCDPPERLRQLMALEPGLTPQGLGYAYELALEQAIALPDEVVLRGLNHRDPAVRGAAQDYLNHMPDGVVTALLASV